MSEKQEIYELIRDSGILCNDCGPHGPTFCADALAELLTQNGYGRVVAIKPLKKRGVRAWLSLLAFKYRTRRVLNMCKRWDFDEMHEHQDDAIHEALKQGLSKKTRQVKTYTTSFMGCLTWDHDKGELHPTREEELKEECARQLVKSLIRGGAIRFAFKEYTEPPPPLCPPRIQCTATLVVVMPEKEEAET